MNAASPSCAATATADDPVGRSLSAPVLSENSAEPSGGAVIAAQEPAESRPTADRGVRQARRFGKNQSVVQTLVIPLVVIVRREVAERPAQVSFTEKDDPVEAFFLDRTDEAFGVRVAIRRAVRRQYDTNPRVGQGLAERAAPLQVSVAEQDPMREKRAIVHIRQRTRDLLDKPVVRMRRRSE